MENKKLTNPVELTEEALDLVAGGSGVLVSPSLPADADRFPAPPSGTGTGYTADLVTICSRCRQRTSADMLYTYQGKKYCRTCLASLFQ